ncbi:hypothetical protein QYM36_002720 [Artemia franciscana]|uniref:Reverse transcriptase domain-containing protein n=1 Tax=Artemia franciscana TaxID=6661 RepID=A0AA88I6P5_ARTSF|nr:hypothetical protein QYM36_002720 [Artemia franciscana]
MTRCAGKCRYWSNGYCCINLSLPLLKLRPKKDLVDTLLHEMIHAYLFVLFKSTVHAGHGPEFQMHMHRINALAGTNITIYHSFHAEMSLYKQHWWLCTGTCNKRPPYFGYVKRSMNRAPGPNDLWWKRHKATCSGVFVKVKEPEGYKKNKKKHRKLCNFKEEPVTDRRGKKRKKEKSLENEKCKKNKQEGMTEIYILDSQSDDENNPIRDVATTGSRIEDGVSDVNDHNIEIKNQDRNLRAFDNKILVGTTAKTKETVEIYIIDSENDTDNEDKLTCSKVKIKVNEPEGDMSPKKNHPMQDLVKKQKGIKQKNQDNFKRSLENKKCKKNKQEGMTELYILDSQSDDENNSIRDVATTGSRIEDGVSDVNDHNIEIKNQDRNLRAFDNKSVGGTTGKMKETVEIYIIDSENDTDNEDKLTCSKVKIKVNEPEGDMSPKKNYPMQDLVKKQKGIKRKNQDDFKRSLENKKCKKNKQEGMTELYILDSQSDDENNPIRDVATTGSRIEDGVSDVNDHNIEIKNQDRNLRAFDNKSVGQTAGKMKETVEIYIIDSENDTDNEDKLTCSKKGDASLCENYRPISLGNCLGKILDEILNKRLKLWLDERQILREEQAGFRKEYSPSERMFVLNELISKYCKGNGKLYVVFLDLSRAFDNVDRIILFRTLLGTGIPPPF